MADLLNTSGDEIRILSFGGGVDSSAILLTHLEVEDLGIDHVIFSDTGAESKGTYENVERFQRMCSNHNIPFTIVRKEGETITEWVTRLGIVPVMAGGSHVCSIKFKGDVIHKWVDENFPGAKITYLIGIEADELKRKQRFTKPKTDNASYEYPLIDRGMTRQDCINLLHNFGLSVPKSSCFFCPFMKAHEIKDALTDPEQRETLKVIESRFAEESEKKHQRWLDAGKPVSITRPKNWKSGSADTIPAKGKVGEHCRIGWRAPEGMWQHNSYQNGHRLFVEKVDGKMLGIEEWEKKFADQWLQGAVRRILDRNTPSLGELIAREYQNA